MPVPTIAEFLKYANVQMAAEAFLEKDLNVQTLVAGNGHVSRFTEKQAAQFLDQNEGWTLVDHKPNTSTGFSTSLFKSNQTGEYVLSMRSTEFIDDAARDSRATNELEIKGTGWAFGQLSDMERWYNELQSSGKLPAGAPLTVCE